MQQEQEVQASRQNGVVTCRGGNEAKPGRGPTTAQLAGLQVKPKEAEAATASPGPDLSCCCHLVMVIKWSKWVKNGPHMVSHCMQTGVTLPPPPPTHPLTTRAFLLQLSSAASSASPPTLS
jgi:hypothetical protein